MWFLSFWALGDSSGVSDSIPQLSAFGFRVVMRWMSRASWYQILRIRNISGSCGIKSSMHQCLMVSNLCWVSSSPLQNWPLTVPFVPNYHDFKHRKWLFYNAYYFQLQLRLEKKSLKLRCTVKTKLSVQVSTEAMIFKNPDYHPSCYYLLMGSQL